MTMGHSSAIWQALCSAALICTSYCALDLSGAKYGTDIVNPHNFSYIHQPNPCQPEETVVFTVHSAVQVCDIMIRGYIAGDSIVILIEKLGDMRSYIHLTGLYGNKATLTPCWTALLDGFAGRLCWTG